MKTDHSGIHDPLKRIETAQSQLEKTKIKNITAQFLIAMFFVIVTIVPIIQTIFDRTIFSAVSHTTISSVNENPTGQWNNFFQTIFRFNRATLKTFQSIDDTISEHSLVTKLGRPTIQFLLSSALGSETSQVHEGSNDWLFYAKDVSHVTGQGFLEKDYLLKRKSTGTSLTPSPQPDPRLALYDLHTQLSRRGITLIVMPTPVKPSVHAAELARNEHVRQPVHNASYQKFITELRGHNLLVFDVSSALNLSSDKPLYLTSDTHWRPDAVGQTADALATFISQHIPLTTDDTLSYKSQPITITNAGDTSRLLGLEQYRSALYPSEEITIHQVTTASGHLWKPTTNAEVLLLGDSFTNIFSLGSMGWGTNAGLAEQLSLSLQKPLDRISQNNNGAFASRAELANQIARDSTRLNNTKVVIFQFATRELSQGDWKLIHFKDREKDIPNSLGTFIRPFRDQPLQIVGKIQEMGRVPTPGMVPYKDHILGIHLNGVTSAFERTDLDGTELIVYVWSMQENELTAIAGYSAGESIQLQVVPWINVYDELGGINRGELSNPSTRLAEPWWGELSEAPNQ